MSSLAINEIKTTNTLFPVFLKLETLPILLIGGGNVALEKLKALLSNSPNTTITVVAEFYREDFIAFAMAYDTIKCIKESYSNKHLQGISIVICATDNQVLHSKIKAKANENNILVNVADQPSLCDFYLGSIVQKGNLKIGISTNGKSPTTAKRIKELLDTAIPPEIDTTLENLAILRSKLNGNFEAKVKRMNELTAAFIKESATSNTERKWKKVAQFSVAAFACMLVGHIIFSLIPLNDLANNISNWYFTLDANIHWVALAGFIAQLVDGSLGMGYGVTSASILMSTGISPTVISGSIHTSEVFSSAASGYSHYKFGNVNIKLFKALVIPGVLGAAAGAVFLVLVGDEYGKILRPAIAIYTLLLGIKFISNAFRIQKPAKKFKRYKLLAAFGGFFDSFGGGGWGPIVTSTLINTGRNHKYVVGSVSLTEFFVTLASAFTFFTMIGVSHWQIIIALMIGSFLAAPLSAKLAGKLPKKTAYILLGTLVIFWSIKILSKLL
jgi:uncharacterized protein